MSWGQFRCSWEDWEHLAEEAQGCFCAVLTVPQSSCRASSLTLNNLQNNPPSQTRAISSFAIPWEKAKGCFRKAGSPLALGRAQLGQTQTLLQGLLWILVRQKFSLFACSHQVCKNPELMLGPSAWV